MNAGLTICFLDNSVDSNYLINLFNDYLRFEPYAFTIGTKTKQWDEKKFYNGLKKIKSIHDVCVYDLNNHIIDSGQTGGMVPFTSVLVEQDRDVFNPENEEVIRLISGSNFVSAYLYYAEYEEIQSTKYINNLKHKNYPQELYDTLKGTPYKLSPPDNGIAYDTRYNPGRMELMSYTWLHAGWKMWFGNSFFDLVPKERLLAFKGACELEELSNGYVYVKLFDRMEESHFIENMRIQQLWRDWARYDELLRKDENREYF